MPAPGQPYTKEETLALIAEKMRSSGMDRFKINVQRRGANGSMAQIAGLDGATYAQIAEPASWLPALLGGGHYLLKVSHSTEQPGSQLGSPLEEIYDTRVDGPAGAPKNTPSLKVMAAPGWPGPPTLFFPSKELIEADQLGKHPFAQGQSSPRAQLSGGSVVMAGGYEAPAPYAGDTQGLLAAAVAKEQEAKRQQEENARRERELNAQQSKMEKENTEKAEALKRLETEGKLREEMRARDAEFKSQIETLKAAAARPVETPKGPGIVEIIAAIGPLVTGFMQQQAATAQAIREGNERLAREQRESAEKLAAAARDTAEKQFAMQMEVLKSLQQKPGLSPEMQLLIETLKEEKKSGSADAMATMMTRMVDAVGVVSKMSIGMIETIATQLGGDPEDPMVTAIKEGAKAMQMLSQGTQAGAQRLIPGAQQRQAQAQAAQKPPQAAPRQAQPQQRASPQQSRPPAPRPAGATATGPQQPPPAPVVATPAPVGVPPPSTLVHEGPQVGFAEAPEPVVVHTFEQPSPPAPSTVELLEASIRGLQDPDAVAQTMVMLIQRKDPALAAELDAAGGDPSVVIGNRLGANFIFENKPYLEALGNAFEQHGDAAGLFTDSLGEPEPEALPAPVLEMPNGEPAPG